MKLIFFYYGRAGDEWLVTLRRRIENAVKHLRWSVLRKQSAAFSR